MIQCPDCKRILLDRMNDGGYKLRSRMILFTQEKTVALCPSCKTEVPVPLQLVPAPTAPEKHTRLVIKNELPKLK